MLTKCIIFNRIYDICIVRLSRFLNDLGSMVFLRAELSKSKIKITFYMQERKSFFFNLYKYDRDIKRVILHRCKVE